MSARRAGWRRCVTVLAFGALWLRAVPAFGCPGCIEGSSPEVYRGFLWGMGLMMAVPAVLLTVVGGGLVRARLRAPEPDAGRFPAGGGEGGESGPDDPGSRRQA